MTFPVVGLCGQAGSGKDLVADFFVEKKFAKVAFSDPMKRFCQQLFNLDYGQLWGPSEARNRSIVYTEEVWEKLLDSASGFCWELIDDLGIKQRCPALLGLWDWLGTLYRSEPLSARIILQTLGTEWGRTLDKNIWINYLYEKIYPRLRVGDDYRDEDGAWPSPSTLEPFVGMVVPDHRFANEILATRERDGYMIHITRPGRPSELRDPGVEKHPSEEEQKTLASDFFHLELELPEGLENVKAVLEDLWQKAPWLHG